VTIAATEKGESTEEHIVSFQEIDLILKICFDFKKKFDF